MTPASPDTRSTNEYDSPYHRRLPFPTYSGLINVLHDHRLFRRLPEFAYWDKAKHWHAAVETMEAAVRTEQAYQTAIKDALEIYGDGDGRLISGVVREHFPEGTKESLRFLAREAGELSSRSLVHWLASGRRSQTWRAMRARMEQAAQ